MNGACKRSVVQQLSTMPSWMFKSGYCTDGSASCLPAYPWNSTTKIGGKYGNQGSELVDESCGQVARYIGRLVGHYTAGGHHDECGHWHARLLAPLAPLLHTVGYPANATAKASAMIASRNISVQMVGGKRGRQRLNAVTQFGGWGLG